MPIHGAVRWALDMEAKCQSTTAQVAFGALSFLDLALFTSGTPRGILKRTTAQVEPFAMTQIIVGNALYGRLDTAQR